MILHIPWSEFVTAALLEFKNGWPILPEDSVEFQDKDGHPLTDLPTYVQITLHKKKAPPNDDNQSIDI